MDRLIYTALTAMRGQTAAQGVTANNLANAHVPGFRRELSSLTAHWLGGDADTTRVEADDLVRTAIADAGAVEATGAPLDIAIDGSGWIAVQARDGSEAYTRRGDLRISASGVLENGEGLAVLGEAGPLTVPPGLPPSIAPDGTLSAGSVVAGRIKLIGGDDALAKRGDGLFGTGAPRDADPKVRLRPGSLESSNVQTASSLAELLEQSRGFDTSTKLLRMTREIDEGGTRLMRLDS